MPAPRFETDRLILRPHAVADFADSLALWSEPEVARFTGGEPRSATVVWDRLFKKIGQWEALGYGYWRVESKADGAAIGEAGFALNKRLLEPAPGKEWPQDPEIGWAFLPSAQGQGFAHEATGACVAWADAQGFTRTVCLIESAHAASLRLAEKLGYRPYDTGGLGGRSMTVLERVRGG